MASYLCTDVLIPRDLFLVPAYKVAKEFDVEAEVVDEEQTLAPSKQIVRVLTWSNKEASSPYPPFAVEQNGAEETIEQWVKVNTDTSRREPQKFLSLNGFNKVGKTLLLKYVVKHVVRKCLPTNSLFLDLDLSVVGKGVTYETFCEKFLDLVKKWAEKQELDLDVMASPATRRFDEQIVEFFEQLEERLAAADAHVFVLVDELQRWFMTQQSEQGASPLFKQLVTPLSGPRRRVLWVVTGSCMVRATIGWRLAGANGRNVQVWRLRVRVSSLF